MGHESWSKAHSETTSDIVFPYCRVAGNHESEMETSWTRLRHFYAWSLAHSAHNELMKQCVSTLTIADISYVESNCATSLTFSKFCDSGLHTPFWKGCRQIGFQCNSHASCLMNRWHRTIWRGCRLGVLEKFYLPVPSVTPSPQLIAGLDAKVLLEVQQTNRMSLRCAECYVGPVFPQGNLSKVKTVRSSHHLSPSLATSLLSPPCMGYPQVTTFPLISTAANAAADAAIFSIPRSLGNSLTKPSGIVREQPTAFQPKHLSDLSIS